MMIVATLAATQARIDEMIAIGQAFALFLLTSYSFFYHYK